MQHNYERCFQTPQKRWIFVPNNECRLKGAEIIKTILKKWNPPKVYFHFQAGGHISAIFEHKANRFFAKIDIQKFFPSISKNRILRVLKSLKLSYKYRLTIAEWSTVKSKEDSTKRILPYGFVQSQILSTLCMDKSPIGTFLRKDIPSNVAMSVYVDDFIISSNDEVCLIKTFEKLVSTVEKTGLFINESKSHPPQLKSTAFNINITQYKSAIEQSRFIKFLNDVSPDHQIRAKAIIAYVKMVCPQQGLKLIQKLEHLQRIP